MKGCEGRERVVKGCEEGCEGRERVMKGGRGL